MTQSNRSTAAEYCIWAILIGVAGFGIYLSIDAFKSLWHKELLSSAFTEIIGFLFLFAAYRAWRSRSARSVRWLCIIAAVISWHLIFTAVDKAYERATGLSLLAAAGQASVNTVIVREIAQLLTVIAAMLFYRLTVRWLIFRLRISDDRCPSERFESIKMSLGLIAFLIFAGGGAVSFVPRSFGNHGPDLREYLIVFGPLVLAVVVYKFGVFLAARRLGISPAKASRKSFVLTR